MIGFQFDMTDLRRTITLMKSQRHKLLAEQRKGLHQTMVRYQRRRWLDNLYDEGSIYGDWRELRNSTNQIRKKRGFQPAHPILYQVHGSTGKTKTSNYLRKAAKNPKGGPGGLLHSWVQSNILADVFKSHTYTASTVWKFRATGAKDGSYAVFHDTAYVTGAGSMIPGRYVSARRIFSGSPGGRADNDDADEYQRLTEEYIDRVIGGF